MKKNIVQDVIPGKKTIRNVELPSRSRNTSSERKSEAVIEPVKAKKASEMEDEFTRPVKLKQDAPIRIERAQPISVIDAVNVPPRNPYPPEQSAYKFEYDEPKKGSRKLTYVVSLLLLVGAFFGVSSLFQSAKISVTPQEQAQSLSQSFVAKKDVSPNTLGFQTVTLAKEVEKILDSSVATKEERVEKKAQGRIVIYNNTTQSQRLVATTRFETPEGLIYRLMAPITIPAKQTVAGKSVAGSIEAVVEADKAGDSYNVGLKDFTIPGFKGDAKFTQVYARSKTEMTGGFSGIQKTIAPEVAAGAGTELEQSLKAALSNDINAQIPADFILYKESMQYSFQPVVVASSQSGETVIKKKGVATAVIFNKAALTKAIVDSILPEAAEEPIRISNLESLSFSLATSSLDISNSTQISFSLNGEPNLVWMFDENRLKSDILGLSKKEAIDVISKYGTIKTATIETNPFWNQSIPTDSEKVTVINTLTK